MVAVTGGSWSAFVVHQAPLNADSLNDADPDTTYEFSILDVPNDWASSSFDDSDWAAASEWSARGAGHGEEPSSSNVAT